MASPIVGLDKLRAVFQKLPEVVRDRLNEATVDTLQQGVRIAQSTLERSPSIQTRTLYNNVGWAMNNKAGRGSFGIKAATFTVKTQANWGAGEIGGRKIRVRGTVVGNKVIRTTRYAHLVEFGSVHMKAEPFMIPAAEKVRGDYLVRCIKAGKDIERDASKIGGRNL